MRLVHVIRIDRLPEFLQIIFWVLRSELSKVVFGIVKIFVLLVTINHFLACMWWSIGSGGSNTWIQEQGLEERDFAFRYLSCFHWSLSHFGGNSPIYAQNDTEMIYAILVLISAFFFATVIIGSLTSSLTRLEIITAQQSTRFAMLREYLRANQISKRLQGRVQSNAQRASEIEKASRSEEEIELLMMISKPLLIQVHHEIHIKKLAAHPFFDAFDGYCNHIMRKICHTAVHCHRFSRGDVAWVEGEVPHDRKMYFLSSGRMRYMNYIYGYFDVLPGEWAGEAVLWTGLWVYCGSLVAKEDCVIASLDGDIFNDKVRHSPSEAQIARTYGEEFIQCLNKMDDDDIMDIQSEHCEMPIRKWVNNIMPEAAVKTMKSIYSLRSKTS